MYYRDQRLLRNFIDDFEPMRDIIEDPETLMKADVPREGWLKWFAPNTEVWLLFPAKLYCGQSLLDSRRESVIIDYAYTDEIEGYRASPDSLAAPVVRDKIHMICRFSVFLSRRFPPQFTLCASIASGEEPTGGQRSRLLDRRQVAKANEQACAARPSSPAFSPDGRLHAGRQWLPCGTNTGRKPEEPARDRRPGAARSTVVCHRRGLSDPLSVRTAGRRLDTASRHAASTWSGRSRSAKPPDFFHSPRWCWPPIAMASALADVLRPPYLGYQPAASAIGVISC
jgi:hypothetical protein